jgi:S1-C subfamily serine protease
VRAGDWILSLDGEPTATVDALLRLLGPDHVGRRATLEVIRGRDRLTLAVDPETDAG